MLQVVQQVMSLCVSLAYFSLRRRSNFPRAACNGSGSLGSIGGSHGVVPSASTHGYDLRFGWQSHKSLHISGPR